MGYAVFFATFALYTVALAPTVTFWDSGELSLGAFTLGVPHHPGYPVFCMLGKAFTFIPLGNVAFRTNLMSAVMASAAVYVLYRLYLLMFGFLGGHERPLSASFALLFAVSPAFMGQAVVTEVYALNALIFALVVYALVLYGQGGRVSWLYLAGLLLGLAFGNHHSAFFLLPGVAVYLAMDPEARKEPVRYFVFLFFAAFGFGVNLYLPVRAHAGPVLNIGAASDLGGLLWLSRWPMYTDALSAKMRMLPDMLTAGRAAMGLAGAAASSALVYTARDRRMFSFLFITALTYYGCVRMLAAGDAAAASMGFAAKFYIPAVMLLPAIVAAWLPGRLPLTRETIRLAALPTAAVCLALTVWVAAANFRDMDNSRNYYAWDFCADALKSVSEGGALFAWGDNEVFPAWYLTRVERYREDVLLVDTTQVTNRWYVRQMIPEIERRYGVAFKMPGDLNALQDNILELNRLLYDRTGLYYTTTASHKLNVADEDLFPQGLVSMVKRAGRGREPGLVWAKLVKRGGGRDGVPRTQVAEDIFGMYGYQAFIWGEEALRAGRRDEARDAYNKAWHFGYKDRTVRDRLEMLEPVM